MRSTPGHRQSSTSFCRAHRAPAPVACPAVVASVAPIERRGLCPPLRARRGHLVLGGLTAWVLLTTGTMVLVSALA